MPRRCCIPGCKSNYDSVIITEGVKSVFRFPKEDELRNKWMKSIPRKEWTPTKNSVVCELHFIPGVVIKLDKHLLPDGTINMIPCTPKLNKDAIPTIFPNLPKYLSKQKPIVCKVEVTERYTKRKYRETETSQQDRMDQPCTTQEVTKDESRTKQWQKNCGNVNIALMCNIGELKRKLICELHFLPRDIRQNNKRKLLTRTAVPILYSGKVNRIQHIMSLEFLKSEKGKPKLCYCGHLFYKDKQKESKVHWKCQNYRKTKCEARVTTVGNTIVKTWKKHNHYEDAAGVEAAQLLNTIRTYAETTNNSPHSIISNVSKACSLAAAPKLPSVDTMKRTIRNIRNRNCEGSVPPTQWNEELFPQCDSGRENNYNEDLTSESHQFSTIQAQREIQTSTEIDENYETVFSPQLQYRLPHEEVTVPSADEEPKIRIVPSGFLIKNDNIEIIQDPLKIEETEEYKCRTCLSLTNETSCRGVTKICFSNKTIKELIILLVPQMVLTVKDSDVVCNDCLEVLESCMKFISRCLEVEQIFINVKQEQDTFDEETTVLDEYIPSVTPSKTEDTLMVNASGQSDSNKSKSISNLTSSDTNVCEEITMSESVVEKKISENRTVSPPKSKIIRTYEKRVSNENETNRGDEEMLSCKICSDKFTSDDYKIHLEIHPPHACDICGKAFVKKDSLKAHKITHNDPNSFLCEICGRGCKEYLALIRHRETHSAGKSFTCNVCGNLFKNKRRLTIHTKYVHNRVYTGQCPHCGLMAKKPGDLKCHIKLVHLKIKPHQCNICKKRFGRRDYLLQHLETHAVQIQNADAMVLAETNTESRGKSPQNLEVNSAEKRDSSTTRRAKSNRKPKRDSQPLKRTKVIIKKSYERVPCKFCGKVIEGKTKLETHLYRHINRFKCHFCPQTFVAQCTRNKHEAVHQRMAVFFRCNVCYKKFKTKEELDAHAATKVHRRPPRYSCNICAQKFHRRFTLSQHTLSEHVAVMENKKLDELVYDDVLQNNEHILNGPINRTEDKNSDKVILQNSEHAGV